MSKKIRLVYLGGPIANQSKYDSCHWRGEAAHKLEEAGIASYSPAHSFLISDRDVAFSVADLIMQMDRTAIGLSDAVLVNLPPDVITIGSVREIEHASYRLGDRKVVVCHHKLEVWLSDLDFVHPDLNTCINWIIQQNK